MQVYLRGRHPGHHEVRDTQAIDVCARAFVRGAARASAFALGVVPPLQADVAQSWSDVAEPFAFRVQLDTGVAVMFGVLCVLTEDQAATQTTRLRCNEQSRRANVAALQHAKFGMQHATCNMHRAL